VVVLVVALAAAGYLVFIRTSGTSNSAAPPSPVRSACPATPDVAGGRADVAIRNGSLRTGLAAGVAHQLRRHGFAVRSVGNANRLERDVALIRYPASGKQVATTLARYVPGARLQPAGVAGVELDLGTRFRSLAAAAAMRRTDVLRRQARRAQACAAKAAHG
jgi:hypothetical protein